MKINWTAEQEEKIKVLFPDPKQAEKYKEATELLCEVLKESQDLNLEEEQISLISDLKSKYEVLKVMRENLLSKDNKCAACNISISKEKMTNEPLSYRIVMSLDDNNLLIGSCLVVCWPCWQGFCWWKEESLKEKKLWKEKTVVE